MRTASDERKSAKYAHIEYERRWLVDHAQRPNIDDFPHVLIEDRYINNSRLRLRKMTDGETGETALKLTKKYEAVDPTARPIVTAYLSDEEFTLLAALAAWPLTKRRYRIPLDGREWSLDRFEGPLSGLELVEIEQSSASNLDALVPPAWTVREISNELAYQGGSLAIHGVPQG